MEYIISTVAIICALFGWVYFADKHIAKTTQLLLGKHWLKEFVIDENKVVIPSDAKIIIEYDELISNGQSHKVRLFKTEKGMYGKFKFLCPTAFSAESEVEMISEQNVKETLISRDRKSYINEFGNPQII